MHESIEKEGIVTEVITAKTSVGLYKYLREKNLDIKGGTIPALDEYIGHDYSFVVSWIKAQEKRVFPRNLVSDSLRDFINSYYDGYSGIKGTFKTVLPNEFSLDWPNLSTAIESGHGRAYLDSHPDLTNRMIDYLLAHEEYINTNYYLFNNFYRYKVRGVFVSFPTDKIYYPLRLTSVYGSTIIPTDIRILSYVKPQLYKDIEAYVSTEYYFDSNYYGYGNTSNPFNWKQNQTIRYTKVSLKAPSKLFTSDLYFTSADGFLLRVKELFTYSAWFFFIPIFLILTFIAGCLAALIVWGRKLESKKKIFKYGLLSWFNILSIIVFAYVIFHTKTRSLSEIEKNTLTGLKNQGLATWTIHTRDYGRKLLFVIIFSVLFVALSYGVTWLINFIL